MRAELGIDKKSGKLVSKVSKFSSCQDDQSAGNVPPFQMMSLIKG